MLYNTVCDIDALNAIKGWAKNSLSERQFDQLVAPYLQDSSLVFKQKQILDCLKSLKLPPPRTLMEINSNNHFSPYEFFLLRFFDPNPTDKYVYTYFQLLNCLSPSRFNIILPSFLRSLNDNQNIRLIPNFPKCDTVYKHLIDLLTSEKIFLKVFQRLFELFNDIPQSLLPFLNKSLRNALKSHISVKNIDVMLSIVFCKPANPYPAIDFFFSAFLTDITILPLYFGNTEKIRFFHEIQKVDVLPISYLNFLTFSNTKCQLSLKQLWSFFLLSPSLTFDYLDSYELVELKDILHGLLKFSQSSNSCDDKIYFFLALILFFVIHPKLIPLFDNFHLQKLIDGLDLLSFVSYKKVALLAVIFLLCRISENASVEFLSISTLNLSKLISFSISFDIFVEYFIWILNPATDFPLNDVYFTNMKENLSYLPLTAYSFSCHILPMLISSLLKIGIRQHRNNSSFMKLVNTINHKYQWEKFPYSLLLGISNEELMSNVIPIISENEIYFNLVKYSLSISCSSQIFSQVYEKLAHDDERLLKFFLGLSASIPLVNDFLRIDDKHSLPLNCMDTTITMWVRFLSSQSLIAEIKMGKKTTVYLRKERNALILEINDEKSRMIALNSDIDGWYFLCISIKPNYISLWHNLQKLSIDYHFGQNASISIGSFDSSFDLQSLHVFQSELAFVDICRYFALGPNHKRFLKFQTFYSDYEKEALYVTPNEFISSLYLAWHKKYNSQKNIIPETFSSDQLFSELLVFSISPPFNTLFASKNIILNSQTTFSNSSAILKKRFYFESFFNSLEMHGGMSLLIHFLSFIILKKSELHSLVFSFFSTLINRFPFIHYYFVKNHVYQLIGHLLWKNAPDPKTISNCAMVFQSNGCIITNAAVIQYWFLGPSFFHCEYHELVQTILQSFEGTNKNENLKILEKADAFPTIIQSISTSIKHSEQFLSGLMALALNLTTQENAHNNAQTIKNYLLRNHFNQKDENDSVNKSTSTISLLHLLNEIMARHHNTLTKFSLRSLMPIFIGNSAPVLCSLYDLMIKYSHIDDHSSFIAVLSKLQPTPQFADYVFRVASQFVFKNDPCSYDKFYFVTISLLYLVNQDGKEDYVMAIVSESIKMFEAFKKYHSYIFNHILLLISFMYTKNKMVMFFGHDKTSSSTQVTSFCLFLVNLLLNSIVKNQTYELAKTFLYAFITLDNGEYSILLIAHIFDALNSFLCDIPPRFIATVVCDLFAWIPRIIEARPQFIPTLMSKICEFVDLFHNLDIIPHFKQLLNNIACKSKSIANSIKETVQNCQTIQSLPDCQQTLGLLDSYEHLAIVPISKVDQQKFIVYKDTFESNLNTIFLTVYCSAVMSQTQASFSLSAAEEENDSILEQWQKIFTELNFPASYIYRNCPMKYEIDNETANYHIRRVLKPLNPSFNFQYDKFWASKYRDEQPKPKLVLSEVFDGLKYSHSVDVPFTCEVCQLKGISLVKGVFIVTNNTIKFYTNDNLLTFNEKTIHAIRFTNYQHQPIGLFIETVNVNSYLFVFETTSIRDEFVKVIKTKLNVLIIKSVDLDYLNKKITSAWCSGKISNFDYLIYLNFLSGRTFGDFTQYLIFPWVCSNFLTNHPDVRDFQYPFFAQKKQQRQACANYYKITSEVDKYPHDYPNYVSNVGTALYFLVRLEPFTTEEIEFQGGELDGADRTFQSFAITADIMLHPGSKSTCELIPEAYYLPEFLENINGIVFPTSPNTQHDIGNVHLPDWNKNSMLNQNLNLTELNSSPLYRSHSTSKAASSNISIHPKSSSKPDLDISLKSKFFDDMTPVQFIRKMRKILESKQVSEAIHEWIDLIWGIRRTGDLAHERLNLLPQIIFQFNKNEYLNNIRLLNAFNEQLHNCGQAPIQLFFAFHPKKEKFIEKGRLSLTPQFKPLGKILIDKYGFDIKSFDDQSDFYQRDRSIVFPSGIRISIKQNEMASSPIPLLTIEKNDSLHLFNFSNEIQPTLICTSKNVIQREIENDSNIYDYGYLIGHRDYADICKNQFLTSHKTPFLNLWYFDQDDIKLTHLSTLRGHNNQITAIALNSMGRTAFSGHLDGTISSFRLYPHMFLRKFRCKRMMPISKISIMFDNSSLLVVQNRNMDDYFSNELKKRIENEINIQLPAESLSSTPGGFISLFTINGEFIQTCEVDDNIKDVVLTSFDNGIQTNYAILLTESSNIYIYSMNSLKRKKVIKAQTQKIEMIYLKSNTMLIAFTKNKTLLKCQLFDNI